MEDGLSNVAYFRTDGGSTKLYTQEYVDKQEKEIERLKKELGIEQDISEGMLETIDKAIEYIEDKWEMELKDSMEDFLDHDERIERKRLLHVLEILKKEENNESSNINREIN